MSANALFRGVSITRRSFLGGVCVGGFSFCVRANDQPSSRERARATKGRVKGRLVHMLDKVTVDDFSPYVGGTFFLFLESGERLELELIEATSRGSDTNRPAHLSQRESFSLLFRARAGAAIPQRIYRMQHEHFGAFELFLVPIDPSNGPVCLEAVFN